MAFIYKKMGGSHAKWFSHMQSRAINAPIKNRELDSSQWNAKGRGSPKIILINLVKEHLLIKDVTKTMISDIIE